MAVLFNSARRSSSIGPFHCVLHTRMDKLAIKKKQEEKAEVSVDEETIMLNIGGHVFETFRRTLTGAGKSTKLADKTFLRAHFRVSHGDYFFDRDHEAFKCVLNFLRTGELHVPTHSCGPMMKRELMYWGVDDEEIGRCCWGHYNTWNSQHETLDELEKDITSGVATYKLDFQTATSWQKMKSRIWDFLENPTSSKAARVYTWVSIMVVVISIFTFCAETHPVFLVDAKDDLLAEYFITDNNVWEEPVVTSSARQTSPSNISGMTDSLTGSGNNSTGAQTDNQPSHLVPHAALIIADFTCLAFFTLEYLFRLAFSPKKKQFLLSALNIIDLVAILPDYIELIVLSLDPDERKEASFVDFIFILRIIRILRVFRLIRHVPGLWILLFTLRASLSELFLMMIFLIIGMLVFATLIYFAEGHHSTDFTNIPIGFWWSLVTMTTVGYGDVYPRTGLGYLVGALCALSGLLMLALTVPIIVGNFVLYYTHIQYIMNKKVKGQHLDSTDSGDEESHKGDEESHKIDDNLSELCL